MWAGMGYFTANEIDRLYSIAYVLKNGKGLIKEFHDNSKLKFECEYLNGQKNGIGKEYNLNDGKIFEGEFLRDKKNGKGKEYFFYGKLKFEGQYHSNFRIRRKLYRYGKVEFDEEFLYDKNGMKKDII